MTLWQRTHQDTAQDESLRPINTGSGRFDVATVLADTWEIARAAGRCRDEPQQFGASTPTHGSFRHTDRRESLPAVPSPQPVEHDPRLASFALVRPDGILAVRGRGQNIDKLVSYLQQIGGVPSIPSRFRPEACSPANSSFQATSADKANSVSYSRGPLLTGPAEHIKRMARTGQRDRQFHAPPTHRGIRE